MRAVGVPLLPDMIGRMPTDVVTQTLVSFSLTVLSPHPIDDLAPFAAPTLVARTDDDYMYGIYKTGFEDVDDTTRADRLHEIVTEALDLLDATGVSPSELHHEDVRVRAFFTFDPGAETIRPDVVRRLARINSTIWIDANV
jgi:hypothetical protein